MSSEILLSSGGCFTGDCRIKLYDGHTIRVDELIPSDILLGGFRIDAIINTPVNQSVNMIKFKSGLTITPWHPIVNPETGEWDFPEYCGENQMTYVDTWYNLALETGHIAHINGYKVVTLGHDFHDNDIVRHPYFGTHAVIDDLKTKDGWNRGRVTLYLEDTLRSYESGLIQKI